MKIIQVDLWSGPVEQLGEARLVRELSKEILQKLGEEARLSLDPIVPPAHLGQETEKSGGGWPFFP